MKEAIRFGIARGLFSNESGLGSAPIVAAAAQTKKHRFARLLVSTTGTVFGIRLLFMDSNDRIGSCLIRANG